MLNIKMLDVEMKLVNFYRLAIIYPHLRVSNNQVDKEQMRERLRSHQAKVQDILDNSRRLIR